MRTWNLHDSIFSEVIARNASTVSRINAVYYSSDIIGEKYLYLIPTNIDAMLLIDLEKKILYPYYDVPTGNEYFLFGTYANEEVYLQTYSGDSIPKINLRTEKNKEDYGFDYSGSSNRMVCNEFEDATGIDVVKLDDYFAGQKVTFIKADIEGMEMQALKGARELIKKQKPKMAICIYHLPWDIYKIPILVKELNYEY